MKNFNLNLNSDFAILNIVHSFNCLQQKIWNLMFYSVFNEINHKNEHRISIVTISNFLHIKDLKKIKNIILEMEFKPDSNLLSYYFETVNISNNLVCFTLPNHLKILLKNKLAYEITNNLLKFNFSTKYSLFLYEFCLYYYFLGCNQIVLFRDFRHYLGISTTQYDNFKIFENKILIPSLFEIKDKAGFSISIKYEKEAHSIIGFRFNISCKRPFSFFEKGDYLEFCRERSLFVLQNIAFSRYLRFSNAVKKITEVQSKDGFENKDENFLQKTDCYKDFTLQEFIAPYERIFVEDLAQKAFAQNRIVWTEAH